MKKQVLFIFSMLFIWLACNDEPVIQIEYDDTPYAFRMGDFPEAQLPADNILTVEKVQLGRMLFYETRLSKDNSQSCAGCHRQMDAFNDTTRFSIGVEGLQGTRQAMSVFNMAWHSNNFLWDGRANLLRDQALLPIEDPLEMNETLENVISKLSADQMYKDQFTRAFGDDAIDESRMALALEQFMLSIVSMDSKYDQYLRGEVNLTQSEERGMNLFFTEYNPFFPDDSGADCAHCHAAPTFENDLYMNNGLDSEVEFADLGRFEATNEPSDRGKFKVTSLRNIALTPPYMHDGRFNTLEEVVDHYNTEIKISSTLDPALLATTDTGLLLDDQDKEDLINFMNTLTDWTFINNSEYANPF